MRDNIYIKGAKEHNLKNIDLKIPRDKLVVFTGVSGSGKSSLAFDTIYAEGQRRYVESLSSYARMFLGQMDKPQADLIEGLSPAISIDQKTTSKNPRSTVGTVTEIYDYLRLLYARIGIPHCPNCGKEIHKQTIDQIVDKILKLPEKTRIVILAPVIRGKKGEHQKVLEKAKKSGFIRVRVDGNQYDLAEEIKLDKNQKHTVEIVVDRMAVKEDIRSRLTDSIETAVGLTDGLVTLSEHDSGKENTYSLNYSCPDCDISVEELSPRAFSFNNPFGACPECGGIGHLMKVDPSLVVDPEKSILDGAIRGSGWYSADKSDSIAYNLLATVCKHYGYSMAKPIGKQDPEFLQILLYGNGGKKLKIDYQRRSNSGTYYSDFEGIINNLERRYKETSSSWARAEIESFMSQKPCHVCKGARLKQESLGVTVGGINIYEMCQKPVKELLLFFDTLSLTEKELNIAERLLKEIKERLGFLDKVGLNYLTLSRSAGSLSGGEAQRIRLATQIGSYLMGVLYILDEPSIGLHQRDNEKLIETLIRLRDVGNSVLVVEHDEDTIRAADYVFDFGPGAGIHGGYITAEGTPEEIMKSETSLTGDYLSGRKQIPVPKERRPGNGNFLTIKGAKQNNLKNITVSLPLGCMTIVTGVSGSGKSSLINQILYQELFHHLNGGKSRGGLHDAIEGMEHLDKVIAIDQSPIGRTPRSNPATYTGVFSLIRDLFAATNDAKMKGYGPGRFSFNVKGGRCEACEGDGIVKIEMHFLPDVFVPCDVCKGKRYNRETLEVRYKGKNIHEVLDMTVEEGLEFFENIPSIKRKLQLLYDVGLSYIKLGQPSTTLSGGEAQRVKLATELSKRPTGKTIYILDEPTTGLHFDDVRKLIDVLNRLCDSGNTIVIIEHNLDVIKVGDYIIDMGPEGGDEGGTVVATGTPEEVAKVKESHTGRFLRDKL
ncbi:MAG: excinuclease ABC subunit UvrA [Clostridia bacterium]|nr:excinuclease ABC subunit UvrA [Clostridia bacterium]